MQITGSLVRQTPPPPPQQAYAFVDDALDLLDDVRALDQKGFDLNLAPGMVTVLNRDVSGACPSERSGDVAECERDFSCNLTHPPDKPAFLRLEASGSGHKFFYETQGLRNDGQQVVEVRHQRPDGTVQHALIAINADQEWTVLG